MNRPQLFSRTLSIMFRSGSLWLVTLAVTAVNVIISLVLPAPGTVQTILRTLLEVITGAFLAGALITLVNAAAESQPAGLVYGFQAGVRFFVPLLLVGFILAIPTWILTQTLDLVLAPLTSTYLEGLQSAGSGAAPDILAQAGVLACCLAPLILVVFLLVALVAGAVSVGAQRAVALESLPVGEALKRAWKLMTSRLSDFLVTGLLMLAILVGVGVLFGCPAVLILAFASGVSVSAGSVATSMASYTEMITIFASVLGIPLTILFSGVWTLAFRHWQGKEVVAVAPPPAQPFPPAFPGA